MISAEFRHCSWSGEIDVSVDVQEKAKEMFMHFCSVLIDGLFLFLWAAMNYGVHAAVGKFKPEGSDIAIGFVLQVLFGFATLVPLAIFIYRDIRIMWIKANQTIGKSRES